MYKKKLHHSTKISYPQYLGPVFYSLKLTGLNLVFKTIFSFQFQVDFHPIIFKKTVNYMFLSLFKSLV